MGTYEGLLLGFRLRDFESRIRGDPRKSFLANRIEKFPCGTGAGSDRQLCQYLDGQVERLRTLHSQEPMPLPLERWRSESWVIAFKNKPQAVSKYISQVRKMVLSENYTMLLALRRSRGREANTARSPTRVKGRSLGLDQIYDEEVSQQTIQVDYRKMPRARKKGSG